MRSSPFTRSAIIADLPRQVIVPLTIWARSLTVFIPHSPSSRSRFFQAHGLTRVIVPNDDFINEGLLMSVTLHE